MRLRIKEARERIEALRIALTGSSPAEIGAALPGLEEAVRCLETVEQDLREGACAPYEVRRELKLLKSDLHLNARLIDQGVAFCQGWAKLLGAGAAYTQDGQSAPSEPLASLSVRG
jgi:hypothetical protein